MPHQCLLGNMPGFVHSHDGYPQRGDLFWSPADWAWTGGLMDALLPALHCGQPIVGYRGRFDPERAFALIEKYQIRNAFLFPTALKLMMKAYPAPARALRRQPAQRDERRRGRRDHRLRLGARRARRDGQRDVRADRDELHRRQLAHAVAGAPGLDGPPVSRAPHRADRRRRQSGRAGRERRGRGQPHRARRQRPTPSSSSSISRIRKAPRASTRATGAAPATSRRPTPTATYGTRAAPTTCSRRPATGSARPRSRTAWSGTRPSPMPRSSPLPTRRAATSSRRSSCSPPGHSPSAALEDGIREHVKRHLAPYEYPKEIEFIDALPMTTTGKVQRRVLRERERERKAGAR